MAKTLNTRIQLRYDTLSAWEAQLNTILAEGEVVYVKIPANTTVNCPALATSTKDRIMYKVGDNTTTFGSLPWGEATLDGHTSQYFLDEMDTKIATAITKTLKTPV